MGNIYSRNVVIPIIAPKHVFETGLVQIKCNKQDMEVSDGPVMNFSLFDENRGDQDPGLWVTICGLML